MEKSDISDIDPSSNEDTERESSENHGIPSLTGRNLLEAIHQAETSQNFTEEDEFQAGDHAIPLSPRLLSSPEIEALMRTEAYRTWYHPSSEKVRETVSDWFALTYPGPLNVDSSGRTIRTEDRARPASAPQALARQGPLSLQHAKRLAPKKPTSRLTTSHQRYAELVNQRMTNWHNKSRGK